MIAHPRISLVLTLWERAYTHAMLLHYHELSKLAFHVLNMIWQLLVAVSFQVEIHVYIWRTWADNSQNSKMYMHM